MYQRQLLKLAKALGEVTPVETDFADLSQVLPTDDHRTHITWHQSQAGLAWQKYLRTHKEADLNQYQAIKAHCEAHQQLVSQRDLDTHFRA